MSLILLFLSFVLLVPSADAKTKRVDKLDLDVLLERARVTGAPVTLCRC